MSPLIGTVAGVVTIVGFLAAVLRAASRAARRIREGVARAEQALDEEIERRRGAGATLGGRTDLGFLVLLELSVLNRHASQLQSGRNLCAILSVGLSLLSLFNFEMERSKPYGDYSESQLALSIGLGAYVLALVTALMHMKETKRIDSMASRFREVWHEPVTKRLTDKPPPQDRLKP